MTNKQRFFGEKGYAAPTLGAPIYTQNVDYTVFKNTEEQKSDKIARKMQHKAFMAKHGFDHKKDLNIPELRLEEKIIITT